MRSMFNQFCEAGNFQLVCNVYYIEILVPGVSIYFILKFQLSGYGCLSEDFKL
jgi:hypothetical protein